MKSEIITLKDATERPRKRGYGVQLMPGPSGTHVAVDDYQYTAAEVIFLVQSGLKPGTQIWYRVALNSDMPETQATDVMSAIVDAYRKAGLPEGVELFRAPATGGIVYYLSSQAAALIPDGVNAVPCVKPNMTHMRKVEL